jgi:response regulator of citrate/malate metabolism
MNDIEKLQAENERLVAENAELNRKLAETTSKLERKLQHGLEIPAWNILEHLFKTAQYMTVHQCAAHISASESIAHYHVDALISQDFIHKHILDYSLLDSAGRPEQTFIISPRGRAFYVSHTPAA